MGSREYVVEQYSWKQNDAFVRVSGRLAVMREHRVDVGRVISHDEGRDLCWALLQMG